MRFVNQTERKIIERLLHKLDKADLLVRINDGEENVSEWDRPLSKDHYDEIGETGETYVMVKTRTGLKLGYVWLIHGNNEDVISDVGYDPDNNLLDVLVNEVLEEVA